MVPGEQAGAPRSDAAAFDRADLQAPETRDAFIAITQEYFDWMNGEIVRHCQFSIPDVIGMSLDAYVRHTAEIGRQIAPRDGGIYFQRDLDGRILAMGGLRRLSDDTAEIVRIYTRPDRRGQGLGFQMVGHLVSEARRLGYSILRLDTAVFMNSAQKIYHAAGFALREPYPGAEPPARLLPFWLYMERRL